MTLILKPEDMEKLEKENLEKEKLEKEKGTEIHGKTRKVREVIKASTTIDGDPTAMPAGNSKPATEITPDLSVIDLKNLAGETGSKGEYCISYEPLCEDKIKGIPLKLNYKPIDGFSVTKLNELTLDNIDDGINELLDKLCYESMFQGFTHWIMPTNEKIRTFLNLRLNSNGPLIEHLVGICEECGAEKLFVKVEITKFDEEDLKEKYAEPFPLKAKISGDEAKFKVRMIQSGDIFKAKQLFVKNKELISTMFPGSTDKDESAIIQILEYANSIIEINGQKSDFNKNIHFCKNSIQVMNAITSFNDYFNYGLVLKTNGICENKECPSFEVDEKTGKSINRGSQFRIPFQPSLFYIYYSEKENVEQYFDIE